MKGILIFLMVWLPILANANVDALKKENVVSSKVEKTNEYNVFAKVTVNASDISLPFTITVPAPTETVTGVSGPVTPNVSNWKVENGYLTIVYTRHIEIMELEDGGTFMIEVTTSPQKNYVIELTVN